MSHHRIEHRRRQREARSALFFIFPFILLGIYFLNRDIPVVHAAQINWVTIGWDENPTPNTGTQTFTNVDGTGVDLTVNYSDNMWDNNSVPNIYGVDAPVPPLDEALRWTNNRDDVGGPVGTATGPARMEVIFSEPVFLDQMVVGSLSELTNRFEWGVLTAFDEFDNPISATSFSGSTYLRDINKVYLGEQVIPGRPLIEDLGGGVYRTRGTSLQAPSNPPAGFCDNDACGYDRAIFVYDVTPVQRVEVIQITTTGSTFDSGRSTEQASIVLEEIFFRPATSTPPAAGPGAIGNCVWLDENGDGLQDAGEPGIPNVIVQITDSLNGTSQTITDGDGCYLFDNLGADTYTITLPISNFDPGGPLENLAQTLNPVLPGADLGNQSLPYAIILAEGEENLTADFGFNYSPDDIGNNENNSALGDRVWLDIDEDGQQDPGEVGLEGVTVILTTPGPDGILGTGDDVNADSQVTGVNGLYRFGDLTPGAYGVVIDETSLPAGYIQTGDPDHFGTTGPNDNRTTSPVLLAPGDVFLNVDFGYSPDTNPLGRIGNKIWLDADASQTAEEDPMPVTEPGIAGVTVSLLKNVTETTNCSPTDGLNPIIATAVTDANGMYIFNGLPVDDGDGDYDYIIWVNDIDNVLGGLTQTFDSDGTATANCSITALTAVAAEDLDQDFSYTPLNQDPGDGLIGDTIFFDRDGDGSQTANELGLEGVIVTLQDENGLITTAVTDENGHYFFPDLVPTAAYTVTVAPENFDPGGVLEGMENSADPDSVVGDNQSAVDLNTTGPIDINQDFGYTAQSAVAACLGNIVWLDSNADGTYDGPDGPDGIPGNDDDEPALANVTIDLYRDLDGLGTLDPGDPHFDTAMTTAGRSENGCFTAGDFGNYIFENIPAGSYIVDITDDNGILTGYWHSRGTDGATNESQSDPYAVVVTANSDNLTADFGYYVDAAAVGNYVWLDLNKDGLQDAGEPGLVNIPVHLDITYPNGDMVTVIETTDAQGFYSFNNLLLDENFNGANPAGEPLYTITIPDPPPGFAPTPIIDANGNANDKEDADDPTGTAVQPVQGIIDVTAQPDPNDEPAAASYDFGYIIVQPPLAAVGNYVWLDEDSDGFQDPGERGIPNVTLTLIDMDGNQVGQMQTDTNGGYLFDTLPAGMYTVTLDLGTLPPGLTQTINPVLPGADFGNQTLDYKVTLAEGDKNLTADFGFIYNPDDVNNNENDGAIGDTIWLDDGDTVQQPEEPGIAGVTVDLIEPGPDGLFGTGDDVSQSTVTDDNGYYLFPNLPPGPYKVVVDDTTLPGGLTPSGDPDNFGVPGEESDHQTTTPIPLGPGDVFLNADFGYTPAICGQIGDLVWLDANASGNDSADGGEIGVAGVTVALIWDANGDQIWNSNESIIATDVTSASGNYLFPCLSIDDGGGDAAYLVWVNDTNDVLKGVRQTFDADGIASPDISSTTLDSTNPVDLTQDFSYTPQAQTPNFGLIGDTIWFDQDGDGSQGPGEPGLESVIVTLTDGSGAVITAVTNENGQYTFGGLDPLGTYTVTIAPENFDPGGVLEGTEPTTDRDGNPDNVTTVDLSVDGPVVLDADFGYTTSPAVAACLGNLVWLDTEANGVFDGSESAIGNVTVDLYRDLDGNGQLDVGEPRFNTAVTSGTAATQTCFGAADVGNYLFEDIPAGDYIVYVTDNNGVLAGYWQSRGADNLTNNGQENAYALAVTAGAENLTADFGYYKDLAALGNFVWLDDNNDGLQDAGEPPLPNVRVTLTITYPNGDVSNVEVLTDNNGAYAFGYLLADEDYNADEAGQKPTYTLSVQTPLGFLPTVIDVNGNNNDFEDSDDQAGVTAVPIQGGTDASLQPDPTSEPPFASYDFGFIPLSNLPSAIGNFVWLDENSDGVQDPGELGIGNVTVELLDDSDVVIDTRQTDTLGGYLFANLTAGTYTVRVDETTLPDGLIQSNNPVLPGADLGNQTSPYTIILGAGVENLTADFGYIWNPNNVDGDTGVGTIGDLIWLDGDGDGRYDPEEIGINGVAVTLLGPGPDGIFGTGDDESLATAVTTVNGSYLFSDLPPGQYQVQVDSSNFDPGGPLENTTQTGDPDEFGQTSTNPDNLTTTPIVLAPGDAFLNADFGYLPPTCGQIGDTVWLDANASATPSIDGGEYGISNVSVVLWQDAGLKGVLESFDTIIATAITDIDGQYTFTCLPLDDGEGDNDADFLVQVTDTQTVLAGLVPTFDQDGIASLNISALSLDAANPTNLMQDFSYTPIGHSPNDGLIGDLIYFDVNASGSQDGVEMGVEGVLVTLQFPDGSTAATRTDENGHYYFGGLTLDATYTVTVDTTGPLLGLTNTDDPDTPGAPDSQSVVTITLIDPINLNQDFGYGPDLATSAAIRNLIWLDSNANGTFDSGEEPIGNVTVDLYRDLDGNGQIDPTDPLFSRVTSQASLVPSFGTDGNYQFAGLPAGDYIVNVSDNFDILTGYWHSLGTDNVDNESQATPHAYTVGPGETIETADFGYYISGAAVGNRTWIDTDGNGVQDLGEPPLAGVTLTLQIDFADGSTISLSTLSDSDGAYQFGNLMLDEDNVGSGSGTQYTITAVPPAGFVPTQINIGNDQSDSDDPAGTDAIPIKGGLEVALQLDPLSEPDYAAYDFGFHAPLQIGDRVFSDLDNDGLFEPLENEIGIPGVLVELLDEFGAPILDLNSGLPVTILTNEEGFYTFTGLSSGSYIVRISQSNFDEPGDPLYGFISSSNPDPTPDPDDVETDFDDNGVDNLHPANGGVSSLVFFVLINDEPVGEDGEDGSVPDPNSNRTIDFGFFELLTLGNRVWNDENRNGQVDANEQGIAGVLVSLLDGNGFPVLNPVTNEPLTAVTDANGFYQFTNLFPGDYSVRIDASNFATNALLEGFISTPGSVDPDNDMDNDDNGLDSDDPGLTGITSLPITISFGIEPDGGQDGDDNDNTNLTVDFGLVSNRVAVGLLYFSASSSFNQVILQWATASEINNFGFNLYRSRVDEFSTAELIHFEPSQFASGSGPGASYEWADEVPEEGQWYYWLESVETTGATELPVPVSVFVTGTGKIYLPVIVAPGS